MYITQGESKTRELPRLQRHVVEWILQLVMDHGSEACVYDDAPKYIAAAGTEAVVVVA